MTPAYGSRSYHVIALALAVALERLHSRLEHGDGEAQPHRKIAAQQRRPAPAKRRSRKQTQKA